VQELAGQVAVGRVDLDAVAARLHRAARGMRVVRDRLADLVDGQRSRRRHRLRAPARNHRALVGDGARGHRMQAVRHVVGMRDAPHVPQLHEDAAAARVHGIGDLAPARNLRVVEDAGRVEEALRLRRDVGALGDDQPGLGTLRVVQRHQRRRHAVVGGARARHRGHGDAVAQAQPADRGGVKQGGGHVGS
jgi:hypothetical protein